MNGVQEGPLGVGECIAMAIFVPILFAGAMFVIGAMMDGAAKNSEQHDRCMKYATDGTAISRCR